MVDREQLRQAIDAQERLRGSLPDAVVDAAVVALRAQLHQLDQQPTDTAPKARRRQATLLFADVAGFTALSENMDPELVAELINELWSEVDVNIEHHGGRVDKHIGDAVMGVWGIEGAREDDPERAVRAALTLRTTFEAFRSHHGLDIDIRVGVNTGPVLAGGVGTAGEISVTGDAVNVASRLEQHAPPGQVLVSHDTYRHVRGVFEVRPQDPLTVKGKRGALRTYVVDRAKPRAFRIHSRGVEGVETRMLGRDSELSMLQDAYRGVAAGDARIVTILGEAGVGKSRLLDELSAWLELRRERILYFKGRSVPDLQWVPRGLLRELVAQRFEIFDDDPRSVVAEKLRSELHPLDQRAADLVGFWLGFDINVSEEVAELAGSADLGTLATAELVRFFRAALKKPAVVLLEDVHWADADSLDFVAHLVARLPSAPLLVVAVARAEFKDGHRDWCEVTSSEPLRLEPLSNDAATALVRDILQLVDDVPEQLIALVVGHADGNPFYIEELIKTLIDDRVVSTTDDAAWHVDTERLRGLTVPPTLAGVLQARLDGLPAHERAAVQHGSVIGRTFWDDAVVALLGDGGDEAVTAEGLVSTLDRVLEREVVRRTEPSSFAGCREFRFKHALLRDAAYETVLLRQRRRLHRLAASWMERRAGDRADEHLARIAEHLVSADDHAAAAPLFARAAENAYKSGSARAAQSLYERALEGWATCGEDHGVEATRARAELGQMYVMLGDLDRGGIELRRAERDAAALDDGALRALVLTYLAYLASDEGDPDTVGSCLEQALALAEIQRGPELTEVLIGLGWVLLTSDRLEAGEEASRRALGEAQALGDRALELRALNLLCIHATLGQDYDAATSYIDTALAIARSMRNGIREAMALNTKGALVHRRATIGSSRDAAGLAQAMTLYRRAIAIGEDLGAEGAVISAEANLCQAVIESGSFEDGRRRAHELLCHARTRGLVPRAEFAALLIAEAALASGDVDRGLGIIRVLAHDGRMEAGRDEVERVLALFGIDTDRVFAAECAEGQGLEVLFDELIEAGPAGAGRPTRSRNRGAIVEPTPTELR